MPAVEDMHTVIAYFVLIMNDLHKFSYILFRARRNFGTNCNDKALNQSRVMLLSRKVLMHQMHKCPRG